MKLSITNVDKVTTTGAPGWMVTYAVEQAPGQKAFPALLSEEFPVFKHIFPEEKIMNTIAEYNLDPANLAEVLDIILAEPFLEDNDGEPTLFSGEDHEVITAAHKRRCARAKLATRLSSRGIQNPAEMIRGVVLDLEEVVRRKKIVADELARRRTSRRARG